MQPGAPTRNPEPRYSENPPEAAANQSGAAESAAVQTGNGSYPVSGLHCASCAARVETILKADAAIRDARVNLASSTVALDFAAAATQAGGPDSDTRDRLKSQLNQAGYDIIIEDDREAAEAEAGARKSQGLRRLKRDTLAAALLTAPVMIIGMFFMHMPYANWIMLAFTTPVLLIYGRRFFVSAWGQLRQGYSSMDTLVALSTGIAYGFSLFNTLYPEFWLSRGFAAHVYYEAAAAIIMFMLFGKLLEERAKSATATAIRGLLSGQPTSVLRIEFDGDEGRESQVPIQAVVPGDILQVRPGEKIPVDGVVTEGASFIDESMISGEPIPVEALPEKAVYAGTINQKGSFRFRARKVGGDTLLAGIVRMVEEAQGSKAPVQKLVDRVAAVFVPAVVVISILTFLAWLIIVGPDAGFAHALLSAVTVLVIACPCALGLATPTAIMVGIGKGAAANILIKDAESLERAHQVDALVLDKTGTITEGRPRVTDIFWLARSEERDGLAAILRAIESRSEHPLAEAILRELDAENMQAQTDASNATDAARNANATVMIESFVALPGRGVAARSESGSKSRSESRSQSQSSEREYLVGNQALLRERGVAISKESAAHASELEASAKTVVYFADQERVLAMIAIADTIKATSADAIRDLKSQGIAVSMLTGDNARGGAAIAAQIGLAANEFRAEALPADKAEFIRDLQSQGKIVAMAGDGVNDSQALAQADVSIAMGRGSDIAIDVAKITLLTSDLGAIPRALRLSKETVRTIRQNLFWAFVYNLIGIPLAAGVLYPINGFLLNPMIAAAAMAFSSVSVVTNSLRVKWRPLR